MRLLTTETHKGFEIETQYDRGYRYFVQTENTYLEFDSLEQAYSEINRYWEDVEFYGAEGIELEIAA